MNKFVQLIFISLLFLVIVSGCSGAPTSTDTTAPPSTNQTEDNYPEKPITIIVNYDAGGQTDTLYRIMAKVAERHLGQPVVIQNVTGGGGTVGIAELAQAKNDGYTMGNTSSAPMTVNVQTQDVTYTVDSFDYIGAWGQILTGILVRNDAPYHDLQELINVSKNKVLIFSNTQPGGILDFAMQDIIEKEGVNWTSIPTKGLAEGVAAILGGNSDFLTSSVPPSGMDDLRLLVSLSSVRWPLFPDVPTAEELGYDLQANARFALAGPAGLPEHVKKKWEEVLAEVLKDPEFMEAMNKFSVPIDYLPGEQYKEELKKQFDYFKESIPN